MGAGRPPDPSAIKKLKGETRPSRTNKNEPRPLVELPPAPDSLSDVAHGEWTRAAEILYAVRVLTRADLAVFRSYCVNFALAYEAEQRFTREGIIIEETRGGANYSYVVEKAHPAIAVFNQADRQMKESARELGLTPASRTKVQSAPEGTGSPLEQLRAKLTSIKGGRR